MTQRMLHKLPVDAYTSQEWFDREQELIFSRTWRYAGFMEDITEPGQYFSVQAGLNNIFIVMGRDRRLRAFHNICRHRGTQLIRAVGKTQKALTCPYHDWTYDLEGNLISVPDEDREFDGIDKSCLGLKPASVDLWRGMVFVHPDPDAGSIMEWFGDIEPKLGPHKVEELPEYPEARTTYEIKANWKIVVENYIDVYHLSHLHSGTLHMYAHAKAEYGFVGPHFAFWEPPSEQYGADIAKHSPTPLVIPKEQAGAWVPMLFPGIGLAESESSWATFIITPLEPNLTRIENRVRVANASTWEFSKQSAKSYAFWRDNFGGKYKAEDSNADDPMTGGDFTAEDIYACEQQQKSLASPHFEVSPASKGESPVVDHQQVVLDWMEGRT
jgi:Rieske 2Fe-2S family protein